MFKTYTLLKRWHVIGAIWIIVVGSLLHFTYEWSGKSIIVGLFSPVNESVWEHLKLGYFSLTFFMLIDFWILKNKTTGYFAAKAAGIISMSLLIMLINFIYETVTKGSNAFFHIALFIAGAILCQIVSFNIMRSDISQRLNYTGLIVYALAGILFIVLTPFQI